MSNTEHKNIEIERKFLVLNNDYRAQAVGKSEIAQGYIGTQPGKTVRIRIKDDKAYITIKGKRNESGLSRFEWEKEIDVEDARQLMLLCDTPIITKTRLYVPAGELMFEVDEFHNENEGLVVAEIELHDEKETFEHPQWLGMEVTNDKRFHNSHLTKRPYIMWDKD